MSNHHLPNDFNVDCVCPQCRAIHDGMANMMDTRHPEDGDVSMCIVCGGISIYDHTNPTRLRFPTDDELVEINRDPNMRAIRWAYKQMLREKGPPSAARGFDV